MKKKAAIELSIGTIVVIVLSMAMLILGLVLIKSIFSGAKNVVDMTNEELRNQIGKIFGEEKKLAVYPGSKQVKVKPGEPSGFGVGIKNLLKGKTDKTFSYEVKVSDPDIQKKCGVDAKEAEGWISTGRAEKGLQIAPGEIIVGKVLLNIPEGTPLCEFRYRINVKYADQPYASELMDVIIRS